MSSRKRKWWRYNMNVNEPCACQQSSHRYLRQRINVGVSVKGIYTWDQTVDGTGYSQDELLDLSDDLTDALRNRYGPEI
jgi:hypothetical protein